MFDKMKKVMSKSEFKKLSFSEKLISNFVVNRSGGWELFKEKSDALDRRSESLDNRHVKIMKILRKLSDDLAADIAEGPLVNGSEEEKKNKT